MSHRHRLGLVALVVLTVSSGCLGFFTSGAIPDEQLDEEPPEPYAWDRDVDAHITITSDANFQAVYRVNDSSIELYRRDGLGGRNSIPVRAIRYRYPNGTVIAGSAFDERGGGIERSRDFVNVTFPTDGPTDGSAKFAFTSESNPKRFALPTFVKGSYELVLPPDRRVGFFLFGRVAPNGYETQLVDGQTHVRWEEVSARAITVQYYLQRDLLVFGAIVVVLAVIGAGGVVRYRRKIQQLKEEREELGLDVDTEDDDFGRGPPPGMQ